MIRKRRSGEVKDADYYSQYTVRDLTGMAGIVTTDRIEDNPKGLRFPKTRILIVKIPDGIEVDKSYQLKD